MAIGMQSKGMSANQREREWNKKEKVRTDCKKNLIEVKLRQTKIEMLIVANPQNRIPVCDVSER
jgi:hypothetical protein